MGIPQADKRRVGFRELDFAGCPTSSEAQPGDRHHCVPGRSGQDLNHQSGSGGGVGLPCPGVRAARWAARGEVHCDLGGERCLQGLGERDPAVGEADRECPRSRGRSGVADDVGLYGFGMSDLLPDPAGGPVDRGGLLGDDAFDALLVSAETVSLAGRVALHQVWAFDSCRVAVIHRVPFLLWTARVRRHPLSERDRSVRMGGNELPLRERWVWFVGSPGSWRSLVVSVLKSGDCCRVG